MINHKKMREGKMTPQKLVYFIYRYMLKTQNHLDADMVIRMYNRKLGKRMIKKQWR